MTERSIGLIMREALAYHEAFRRLGFAPHEIYFYVHDRTPRIAGVLLKSQGLEFLCSIAQGDLSPDALQAQWKIAAAWWNDPATLESERQDIWLSSQVGRRSAAFMLALLAKGFALPRKNAAHGLAGTVMESS
jgi:hypothetical protein